MRHLTSNVTVYLSYDLNILEDHTTRILYLNVVLGLKELGLPYIADFM